MSSIIPIPGGSSDASRPPSRTTTTPRTSTPTARRPSILKPTSDHRLNSNGNDDTSTKSLAKKRSHDAFAVEEDLLKPPIVVKPHPQNLSVKPRSLQPLMLLPREHLRLSFLDLHSPYGSFESAQYFESNIKILDLEGRVGTRPVVLLARLESDKTIYALERQENGLYSLCHLVSWVDLTTLSDFATVSCSHLIKKRPSHATDSNIPQPIITHQLHKENKKRKLAIEAIQSLVKRPTRSRSVSTPTQAVSLATQLSVAPAKDDDTTSRQDGNVLASQDVAAPTTTMPRPQSQVSITPGTRADESLTPPTANDIFDNIRNQYMEALYHSMGSLAYFAKGPLSRARAAFHLDCDSTLEMNDLIDFLKSLVMNTVQIDKKYRETLPDIISKMSLMQDSDNEHSSAKTKKTTVKKMKLGKNGLYPLEDEHVRRWWTIHKPLPKDDETMTTSPNETKNKLSYLRSRETQLQMIIILEILALEPLRTSDNAADSQLPGLPSVDADGETPKQISVKKRNRHNFPFLLDVHADRLCIWHSTALDEVKMMDDSQVAHKSDDQNSLRPTSDPLKDFCVDVIVPFFSARLPEQCDSINRKLGGPVKAPPSAKMKSRNTEVVVKSKPKPGSSAKRPVPVKSAKPLDKVLSKETEKHRRSMSRGPSGYIALLRSTSTSMLKREPSEPSSMTNIPKKEPSETNERASVDSTAGLVKRKTVENKAQKEAIVKAELQDAINSIRRPNRDVVGKDMAETTERRATTSLSQLRKSKKPTQHPRLPGGIVKATPMGVTRFRDALARDAYSQPAATSTSYMASIEADHIPSSSSLIPSSAPRRKRNRDAAFAIPDESPVALPPTATTSRRRGAAAGNGGGHHIEATPGRPSALKHTDFFVTPQQQRRSSEDHYDDAILASSPIASRKMPQPNFAVPPRRRPLVQHADSGIGMMPSSPPGVSSGGGGGGGTLAETPRKPRRSFQLDRHHQERPLGMPEGCVVATPVKAGGGGSVAVAVTGAETTTASDGGNKVAAATAVAGQTQTQTPRRPSIYERLGWDDDFDELG